MADRFGGPPAAVDGDDVAEAEGVGGVVDEMVDAAVVGLSSLVSIYFRS